MTIFVFGNPDLEIDNLPLRILPQLQKIFPEIEFEVKDPNEEWDVPEELIVIDTVFGLKDIKVFGGLDKFSKTPNMSMHDFDALSNLRYMQKLGKIKKVKVIGIPPNMEESEAIKKVSATLR